MLFFRENPCHLWLCVHRATTAGLEQCGETAWETIPYGDLRRSLFGGVGTYASTDGATGCAAVDPCRARPAPAAQNGVGNVPVHVTPIGARSIEHRWIKILSGLARDAQSLSRMACAESLALIAQ
jgi:hypothetical protein